MEVHQGLTVLHLNHQEFNVTALLQGVAIAVVLLFQEVVRLILQEVQVAWAAVAHQSPEVLQVVRQAVLQEVVEVVDSIKIPS